MEFSPGGASYWPALMAVRKASTRWIRRDWEYMIRNNFQMEDVPASVLGPSILLSGDVERNPGPSPDQVTVHVGSIMNMTHFMARSIGARAEKARLHHPELHPCILPENKNEARKF